MMLFKLRGRIASDLKLSRRTVIRALNDLRGAGLVTTEQRQGCRKANTQSASGRRTARCLHKVLGRMVGRVVWGLGWIDIDIASSDYNLMPPLLIPAIYHQIPIKLVSSDTEGL